MKIGYRDWCTLREKGEDGKKWLVEMFGTDDEDFGNGEGEFRWVSTSELEAARVAGTDLKPEEFDETYAAQVRLERKNEGLKRKYGSDWKRKHAAACEQEHKDYLAKKAAREQERKDYLAKGLLTRSEPKNDFRYKPKNKPDDPPDDKHYVPGFRVPGYWVPLPG